MSSATLRVWDLDKMGPVLSASSAATAATAAGGSGPAAAAAAAPSPARHHKVFGPKHPESEVTALAVSEAVAPALMVAVGLASGEVALFQVWAREGWGGRAAGAGMHTPARAERRNMAPG